MKTYIINLEHRKDRLNRIIHRLDKINLNYIIHKAERPMKINGFPTLGQHGCLLSHLRLLESVDHKEDLLIFEDDAVIRRDIMNHIYNIDFNMNWDIYFLGVYIKTTATKIAPDLYQLDNGQQTHAIIIKNSSINKIKESYYKLLTLKQKFHVDIWLFMERSIIKMTGRRTYAIQEPGFSDGDGMNNHRLCFRTPEDRDDFIQNCDEEIPWAAQITRFNFSLKSIGMG